MKISIALVLASLAVVAFGTGSLKQKIAKAVRVTYDCDHDILSTNQTLLNLFKNYKKDWKDFHACRLPITDTWICSRGIRDNYFLRGSNSIFDNTFNYKETPNQCLNHALVPVGDSKHQLILLMSTEWDPTYNTEQGVFLSRPKGTPEGYCQYGYESTENTCVYMGTYWTLFWKKFYYLPSTGQVSFRTNWESDKFITTYNTYPSTHYLGAHSMMSRRKFDETISTPNYDGKAKLIVTERRDTYELICDSVAFQRNKTSYNEIPGTFTKCQIVVSGNDRDCDRVRFIEYGSIVHNLVLNDEYADTEARRIINNNKPASRAKFDPFINVNWQTMKYKKNPSFVTDESVYSSRFLFSFNENRIIAQDTTVYNIKFIRETFTSKCEIMVFQYEDDNFLPKNPDINVHTMSWTQNAAVRIWTTEDVKRAPIAESKWLKPIITYSPDFDARNVSSVVSSLYLHTDKVNAKSPSIPEMHNLFGWIGDKLVEDDFTRVDGINEFPPLKMIDQGNALEFYLHEFEAKTEPKFGYSVVFTNGRTVMFDYRSNNSFEVEVTHNEIFKIIVYINVKVFSYDSSGKEMVNGYIYISTKSVVRKVEIFSYATDVINKNVKKTFSVFKNNVNNEIYSDKRMLTAITSPRIDPSEVYWKYSLDGKVWTEFNETTYEQFGIEKLNQYQLHFKDLERTPTSRIMCKIGRIVTGTNQVDEHVIGIDDVNADFGMTPSSISTYIKQMNTKFDTCISCTNSYKEIDVEEDVLNNIIQRVIVISDTSPAIPTVIKLIQNKIFGEMAFSHNGYFVKYSTGNYKMNFGYDAAYTNVTKYGKVNILVSDVTNSGIVKTYNIKLYDQKRNWIDSNPSIAIGSIDGNGKKVSMTKKKPPRTYITLLKDHEMSDEFQGFDEPTGTVSENIADYTTRYDYSLNINGSSFGNENYFNLSYTPVASYSKQNTITKKYDMKLDCNTSYIWGDERNVIECIGDFYAIEKDEFEVSYEYTSRIQNSKTVKCSSGVSGCSSNIDGTLFNITFEIGTKIKIHIIPTKNIDTQTIDMTITFLTINSSAIIQRTLVSKAIIHVENSDFFTRSGELKKLNTFKIDWTEVLDKTYLFPQYNGELKYNVRTKGEYINLFHRNLGKVGFIIYNMHERFCIEILDLSLTTELKFWNNYTKCSFKDMLSYSENNNKITYMGRHAETNTFNAIFGLSNKTLVIANEVALTNEYKVGDVERKTPFFRNSNENSLVTTLKCERYLIGAGNWTFNFTCELNVKDDQTDKVVIKEIKTESQVGNNIMPLVSTFNATKNKFTIRFSNKEKRFIPNKEHQYVLIYVNASVAGQLGDILAIRAWELIIKESCKDFNQPEVKVYTDIMTKTVGRLNQLGGTITQFEKDRIDYQSERGACHDIVPPEYERISIIWKRRFENYKNEFKDKTTNLKMAEIINTAGPEVLVFYYGIMILLTMILAFLIVVLFRK
ncbi:hypothetical protein [Carp edema virus]|nr:hypothetical protein [Carp edema virus]